MAPDASAIFAQQIMNGVLALFVRLASLAAVAPERAALLVPSLAQMIDSFEHELSIAEHAALANAVERELTASDPAVS